MSNREYSVTVIPDNETNETFTSSKCDCPTCKRMHAAQVEWDTFTPRTNLQRGMKEAIARIEARERARHGCQSPRPKY